MMNPPAVLLLLPLLLAACASQPGAPARLALPPGRETLDLHVGAVTEVDLAVRADCEASIAGALRRRGFILQPEGIRVDVEVAFFADVAGFPGGDDFRSGMPLASGSTSPLPHETRTTADLTASIHMPSGRVRQVLASGDGRSFEVLHVPKPVGAPSRTSACAMAAERLATVIGDALARYR